MTSQATSPTLGPWVSPDDIARELEIGTSTVYRMLRAGEMPYYRVGRSYRVPLAAWNAYLADLAAQAQPKRESA